MEGADAGWGGGATVRPPATLDTPAQHVRATADVNPPTCSPCGTPPGVDVELGAPEGRPRRPLLLLLKLSLLLRLPPPASPLTAVLPVIGCQWAPPDGAPGVLVQCPSRWWWPRPGAGKGGRVPNKHLVVAVSPYKLPLVLNTSAGHTAPANRRPAHARPCCQRAGPGSSAPGSHATPTATMRSLRHSNRCETSGRVESRNSSPAGEPLTCASTDVTPSVSFQARGDHDMA